MNLVSRLGRIENHIKSKQSEKGFIVLYNEYGKLIDGVVIKMPTVEADGKARLPDGSEMPIIYEAHWNSWVCVFLFDLDNRLTFLNDKPIGKEKIIDLTGKLIIRNSTCNIMMVTPASKAMSQGANISELEDY
jgi:hypothetical protein